MNRPFKQSSPGTDDDTVIQSWTWEGLEINTIKRHTNVDLFVQAAVVWSSQDFGLGKQPYKTLVKRMISLFTLWVIVLAPAAAVWAWRSGHDRRVSVLTAFMVLLLIGMSLILASPRFGNRLASSEGYLPVAMRMMLLLTLTGALPVISTGLFVCVAGRCISNGFVLYAISIGVAAMAWWAGIFLSFYLYYT